MAGTNRYRSPPLRPLAEQPDQRESALPVRQRERRRKEASSRAAVAASGKKKGALRSHLNFEDCVLADVGSRIQVYSVSERKVATSRRSDIECVEHRRCELLGG